MSGTTPQPADSAPRPNHNRRVGVLSTHEPQWTLDAQQAVHDAALPLQLVRARYCDDVTAGRPVTDGELVTGGLGAMRQRLDDLYAGAEELLAVSTFTGSLDDYRATHRNNRAVVERGVRMLSLFHWGSLDPGVADLIARAEDMPYYAAFGPIQMKVLDRATVVVEGPTVAGERSLLLMRSAEAVAAGMRFIRAVRSSAIRAGATRRSVSGLTDRQELVASLLAGGLQDREIAETLDVSTRTVRSDVADLMRILGSPTRFSAGIRLAREGLIDG